MCPLSGETYSFISPVCNTQAMNGLLRGLGAAYNQEQILMFTVSTSWHKSKELKLPENISVGLLPLCSPGLNLTEHL
jgi:hypothetical protein